LFPQMTGGRGSISVGGGREGKKGLLYPSHPVGGRAVWRLFEKKKRKKGRTK